MKTINQLKLAVGVSAVLALSACGNMNTATPAATTYPQSTNVYTQYGVVQSIELVQQNVAPTTGVGAGTIAGALVGGILGHQVGGGSGNTAATVLGAAGGAYVGNQMEKNQGTQQVNAYKLNIRLNNGTYQAITQSSADDIRVGDRVQIDNGVARRY
ncbi:MAG: glycine zipper 2TM domain-containing protein [Rhodoferax sp.]|uniref:glycine zipper 2TM domain-containing protein n=1 Tax=Rhodoferax sp. TaxID=50421 RepID=UPI002605DEF8|nr:glycine zipper 2TM domain-containing protein [Rhodoferax sp.]MDD2881032.1 glycine zipper 2TM domain-containing protein [Rhodoferax sp.]